MSLFALQACAAPMQQQTAAKPPSIKLPAALLDDDGSVGMRWCSADGVCGRKG